MFTGIVEEIGTIIKRSSSLIVAVNKILEDISIGDSIAVNGVCLTVTSFDSKCITLDVMNATYSLTNIGLLKKGDCVNIERAMPSNGRFGGHIVSGHIDGTGSITNIRKDGIAIWYTIKTTENIMKYIVEKGSVALDGISLTVAKVEYDSFKVSVIPHTQSNTTLTTKTIGSVINIENDIIGKYVEKMIYQQSKGITKEFLIENGF